MSTNPELLLEVLVWLSQFFIEQVDRKSAKLEKIWIILSYNLTEIYKTFHPWAE